MKLRHIEPRFYIEHPEHDRWIKWRERVPAARRTRTNFYSTLSAGLKKVPILYIGSGTNVDDDGYKSFVIRKRWNTYFVFTLTRSGEFLCGRKNLVFHAKDIDTVVAWFDLG